MNEFEKITESASLYDNLEQMPLADILKNINREDQKVALAVEQELESIERLALQISKQLQRGGRLFYIGAGTSGRLGILDASECPPTFGVSAQLVIGIIAGGDQAIRNAVEGAEDDTQQAAKDLQKFNITTQDIVVGIAASGTTPYVVGGLEFCNQNKIKTGAISCNPNSPISKIANFPITVKVGPEFLTGSSRMKAGTAQKMVLNMLTTSVMIQMGRVQGNKMVDMQLSNTKLKQRAIKMICDATNVSPTKADEVLEKFQNVRQAIEAIQKNSL